MKEMKTFWDGKACRKFIEVAIKHYEHAPSWFIDWLDDLYIRLGAEGWQKITLEEIYTLAMLMPENDIWYSEMQAVNYVYKLFNRLGRDTTGMIDF